MHNKLKALKGPLRDWSKKNFDHMDTKIRELEAVVHDIEKVSDIRTLNSMEGARLQAAQALLQS